VSVAVPPVDQPPQMDAGDEQRLRDHVSAACVEMFESCGLVLEPRPAASFCVPGPEHVAAIIGFGGTVTGSLAIAGLDRLFQQIHPLRGPNGPSGPVLLDWVGEVSNQLFGRIKSRLCREGVDLSAGTPTAVGGSDFRLAMAQRPDACHLVLAVSAWDFSLGFDVVLPPDGQLFRPGADVIECCEEGDLILF
jgi:CheY-specific phosphatase CheX